MQPEDLKKMIAEIKKIKAETQTVELKKAHQGCPTKLFDTLSSFSNQDEGGIIIFGIDENDYEISGVYDAQDLQKKVTEQCKQMEPPVRVLFTVCEIEEGKTVVSAEVPGVDISDRPVFYKGVGRIKGSYIRVGESDEPMSEYEIYSYEAFRKRIRDDIRTVENARMNMWDENRLNE